MTDFKELYTSSFYEPSDEGRFTAAKVILPILFKALPKINSAVDLGCGSGAWLAVLKEMGVGEIHGIDGDWASDSLLISKDNFRAVNMESGKVDFDKRYGLAISLEVAEHLPPQAAKNFVQSLTRASDFVLFSAAIPFQGGTNHINEQWQGYWRYLFGREHYVLFDFIRGQIWDDENIDIWYRQNILVFVKESRQQQVNAEKIETLCSVAHPTLYTKLIERLIEKRKEKIAKYKKINILALAIGLIVGLLAGFGL